MYNFACESRVWKPNLQTQKIILAAVSLAPSCTLISMLVIDLFALSKLLQWCMQDGLRALFQHRDNCLRQTFNWNYNSLLQHTSDALLNAWHAFFDRLSTRKLWRMLTYADVCWRMHDALLDRLSTRKSWPSTTPSIIRRNVRVCSCVLIPLYTTIYVPSGILYMSS